ncbi:MAG: T9SS type A sorting domain-containing protein [Bacteroidia bacterium]|nr:T9SS type A sorting domain-containing protein [Bacteroidia bacterium]
MKKLLSTLIITIAFIFASNAQQQFWIKGVFTNVNAPGIQVTVTGYDSIQSPVTYNLVTDTNNSFIVAVNYSPNTFYVVSFTNCNGQTSDAIVPGGVFGIPDTVCIALDYCPTTGGGGGGADTFRDVWVEGTFFNADTNLIPVTITVVDSLTTIYNTTSNSSGYFGTTVLARFSSAIIVSFTDCDGNQIDVQSGIGPIFGGDTVYVILDYCTGIPNWPIDTSCEASFTVQQATTANGTTIPNQGIIYDNSVGNNLQYLWLFGSTNFGVITFDSVSLVTPTYTFNSAGPYFLCLFIFSDSGCFDFFCDTINVDSAGYIFKTGFTLTVIQNTTGIEDPEDSELINAYPNPVGGFLNLKFQNDLSSGGDLQIYDTNGKLVLNSTQVVKSGENTVRVDVADLTSGVYFYKIMTSQRSFQGRFIKQ